jgi:hypothetical protein
MTTPGIPRQFSGDEVLLTAMGVSVTEFAKGTMVSIELEEDDIVVTQGHNGSVLVAVNPNTVATCTFSVMQGSADNDALSAKAALGTAGAGSFSFKDLQGTTQVTATRSLMKKRPAAKAVTEGEAVEYTVSVLSIGVWNVGSNIPL